MKKLRTFFLIFLLWGCESSSDFGPNYSFGDNKAFFGIWKLLHLTDSQPVAYKVTLEISEEKDNDGRYTIKGKSPINFYYASFEANFDKKTMQLYALGNTKLPGKLSAVTFEEKYYELLAQVATYKISADGNTLTLEVKDDKSQEITFTK